ncbi:MAG: hypothetical protein R3F56_22145 [Planctomycetota bacterium]
MNAAPRLLLACCSFLVALAGQKPTDPAAELATMEKSAKDDVAALSKAADWAKAHGLPTEWRRILQRVLELAPDNEAANQALGHVKHDGRWMTAEKAEILRNRAAGLVNVAGTWVPEAEADDARAGVFHFDGERVTKDEYVQLRAGKVRHPRTGELIASEDLEKAKNNLFPGRDGSWVDEAAANKLHSSLTSPWVLRTKSVTVLGAMPLEDLERSAQQYVEEAYDFALGLFGRAAQPSVRPVILISATTDQFRDLGNQIGGPSSAYGAFLAERRMSVPGVGALQPAVALLDPNWGAYYLKHAVGLAVANALGDSLPAWIVSGTGSYAERFYNPDIANWFGKQFLAAGGLMDLEGWFRSFRIDGDMDHAAMGQRLFQAGVLLAFCRHGGDSAASKLLDDLGAAIATGDGEAVKAAVTTLEKGIVERTDALRGYVKTLTR